MLAYAGGAILFITSNYLNPQDIENSDLVSLLDPWFRTYQNMIRYWTQKNKTP
jgi:hypothetical protein